MTFTACSRIITKIWAVLITVFMSYAIVRFSVGGHSPLPFFSFAITLTVFGIFQVGLFFSEEASKAKSKITILIFFITLPALVFFLAVTVEGMMILFHRGMFRDVYYFFSFSAFIYLVQAIRLAIMIIKMTIKSHNFQSTRPHLAGREKQRAT
jgi:hypothetical protein